MSSPGEIRPSSCRRYFGKWLLRLIGLALFVWVVAALDPQRIFAALISARLTPLIWALFLGIPLLMLKSWRWNILLQGHGILLSYREAVTLYGIGQFVGFLTPAQAGEFVKVRFLKQHGYDVSRSSLTIILDRLLDLFALAMGSLAGVWIILPLIDRRVIWVVAFAGVAVVILLVWLQLDSERIVVWISRCRKLIDSAALPAPTVANLSGGNILAETLVLTLVAYVFIYVRVYLLAIALSLPIGIIVLGAMFSFTSLVGLLPVSIAGIGMRELIFVQAFALLGLPQDKAVALSLLILLLQVEHSLIGLGFWLARPTPQKMQTAWEGTIH